MNIPILYEDNHLLIVDKPHGLVTQPSLEHSDSLQTRMEEYIRKKYQKPGAVFLHPIHRLDKEVAGIVIFARTSKALSRMNASIRERKIEKVYLAKVHGIFIIKERQVESFLEKREHYTKVTSSTHEDAKKATLYYKVIRETQKESIVEIELESGRYHQIRAQLQSLGHPILGDTKYGSFISYPDRHIELYHVKTMFEHPVKNTLMTVISTYSL